MHTTKKLLSSIKIYRNNNGKARLDTFNLDNNAFGPMVLDALIYIKNNI